MFDSAVRARFQERIRSLGPGAERRWGRMTGSSALLVVGSRRALGLVIESGLMSAKSQVAITSGTSQQRRRYDQGVSVTGVSQE
jgi:hypothetical protein